MMRAEDGGGTFSTATKKEKFIKCLGETASPTKAAQYAQVDRSTVYWWRKEDDEFRAQWETAYQQGLDAVEDEATRRAVEGVEKPVFYKGDICGHVREYSDTLLMHKLNGERPEKYRRSAPDGGGGNNDGTTIRIIRVPVDPNG